VNMLLHSFTYCRCSGLVQVYCRLTGYSAMILWSFCVFAVENKIVTPASSHPGILSSQSVC
jgi:hypothetical protein